MLSRFSCVQLFATLWTVALQAPLSMGFPRQEYWSGLSFPPPGDLPNPGIEPASLTPPALAAGFFTTSTTWTDLEMIQLRSWRRCPKKIFEFFCLKNFLFIFGSLGLCCCVWAFSSCGEQGLLFVVVGFSVRWPLLLQSTWASVVMAHSLSCPKACGLSSWIRD